MNNTVSIPEVTNLDIAFPTKALKLLPPMADIPEEFKRDEHKEAGVAYLMSQWFEDVKYTRGKANNG